MVCFPTTVINYQLISLFDVLKCKHQQKVWLYKFEFDISIFTMIEEWLKAEQLARVILIGVTEAVLVDNLPHLGSDLVTRFSIHVLEPLLDRLMVSVLLVVVASENGEWWETCGLFTLVHVTHSQELNAFKSDQVCTLFNQLILCWCLCYSFLHHNELSIFQRPGCKHTSSTLLSFLNLSSLNEINNICSLQKSCLIVFKCQWYFLILLHLNLLT